MKKHLKILLLVGICLQCNLHSMSKQKLTESLVTLKDSLSTLKEKLNTLSLNVTGLNQKLSGSTQPQKITPSLRTFLDDIHKKPYNKATLDKKALVDGYGYKKENLEILKELSQKYNEINKTSKIGYTIEVPTFIGISSTEIIDFLKSIKFDIQQQWPTFLKKHQYFTNLDKQKPQILAKLFSDQKYPDGFLDDLKKEFEDAISGVIIKCKNFDNFFPKIKTWLTGLPAGTKIMVRSTGREDTEDLANAGGNESVANVDPKDSRDLLNAVGIVVSSYFSAKSMTQRLGAKDKNLLDTPLVPVLLQVMIGEQSADKPPTGVNNTEQKSITRCGVMYTEEQEGSVFKLTNYATTSGIAIIQASYGHNEGVVNSIVPVDSYFVNNKNDVFMVIRPKNFRLAPTTQTEQNQGKGKLKRIENAQAFANLKALSKSAIRALKFFAQMLERYYLKPMDVEFVIDENTKTIYLVQARPIPKQPQENASYLTINFDDYQGNFVEAETIVSAGGALKLITDINQVIINETIGQALSQYQNPDTKKSTILCVISGEDAPATSHEAATFRGEGKPVLYVKDIKTLESLAEQGAFNFVVDIQQGKIVKWKDTLSTIGNLVGSKNASLGWIAYPIPELVSLYEEPAILKSETITSMGKIKHPDTGEVAKQQTFKYYEAFFPQPLTREQLEQKYPGQELSFKFFIQKLKDENIKTRTEVSEILNDLFYFIFTHKTISDKLTSDIYKKEVMTLNQAFINFSTQIELICSKKNINQKDPQFRMNYLFLLNKLEALIYQQPKDEIINGTSFASLLAKDIEEAKLIKKDFEKIGINDPAQETIQAGRLGQHALTPALKNSWLQFTASVQKKSEDVKNKFYAIIYALSKLEILHIWLHTSFENNPSLIDTWFAEIFDTSQGLAPILKKETCLENLQPSLGKLYEYKQKVNMLNMEGVSDPSNFVKIWDDFYKNILQYFIDSFPSDFINLKTDIEKFAAISIMETLVTKFDGAIKTMEHSPKYVFTSGNISPQDDIKKLIESGNIKNIKNTEIKENKNRIFTFSFMLYYYFSLLQKWYSTINKNSNIKVQLPGYGITMAFDQGYSIDDALEWEQNSQKSMGYRLRDLSKKLNDPTQIQPSKDFNVNIAVIGSGSYFPRTEPKSLEDFFTFTHQSLLTIIGKLVEAFGIKDAKMPEPIKKATTNLKALLRDNDQNGVIKPLVKANREFMIPISTKLDFNKLQLKFNYPQDRHSATITFSYKKAKNMEFVDIEFKMFGNDHYARFAIFSDVTEILNDYFKIPSLKIKTPEKEIELSCSINYTNNPQFQKNVEDFARIICILSEMGYYFVGTSEQDTFLNGTGKYSQMPTFTNLASEKYTADIIQKIIQFSANPGHSNRIYWSLEKALDKLDSAFATYEKYLDKISLKSNLSQIKQAISTKKFYTENSEIFLHRQPIKLLDSASQSEIQEFYGLTPENYMLRIGATKTAAAQGKLQNIKLKIDTLRQKIH